MALTILVPNSSAFDNSGVWSSQRIVYAKVTFDSSYPGGTGYTAATPGAFGFSTIVGVFTVNPTAQSYNVVYDYTNKSLRVVIPGTNTFSEVTSGSNISSASLDIGVAGY